MSWKVAGGVLAVVVLLQIIQVYGPIHHPYIPALSFLILGGLLLYWVGAAEQPTTAASKAWHSVFRGVGEGLVVVAAVVALFELPDFKEFYENGIRKILTTRAYVEKLSPGEQRDIVESVVLSRLGRPVDSAVGRAYTLDLMKQIDEGQYVVNEERYFEKSWTGSARDSMKIENRLTRQVRVFGQKAIHKIDDYVAGPFLYWVIVDKEQCLEWANEPATRADPPVRSQTPGQRNLCASRITKQARGHIIRVDIQLLRGLHTIERGIRRREAGVGSLSTSFDLDYFTQSITLKYHYPTDFSLEVLGDGDFAPFFTGLATPTKRSDQNEFEQSLPDGWFQRGASVVFLLSHTPETRK